MFDPSRPPSAPIPAASVILVREEDRGLEVLLVRRHRKSSFMSDSFVFPGGKIDPTDASPETAAVRELFEEAGVLLATPALDPQAQRGWRQRLNAGEATFADLTATEKLAPATDRLHWWSRWITPSVEPKRFDAQFFVAEMPPGQTTSFDDQETVEAIWLRPEEAIERHAATGFRLPPPQLKTLRDLLPDVAGGVAGLVAAAARRHAHAHPFLPRFAELTDTMALLLPWDPDYESLGVGEALPLPRGHFLASGPSRFVLEEMTWRLTYAPQSLIAG